MNDPAPASPLRHAERTTPRPQDRPDQALEASRAQKAFLAHMRHELRTPLNAMLGYSEMLLEDAADRGQDAWLVDLQKIQTASHHLLALVNDILDPAKIEASPAALDLETVSAHLHHELRTPINAIAGASKLLLEDAEAREQVDCIPDLQKIHAAAERFLAFLNDIVAFSRLHTSALDCDQQAAETASMIQEVVSTIWPCGDGGDAAQATPGSLLIVDDNEINRDVLSRHLARQGHAVTVAANGRQALELLSTRTFDLVLLDIMMPEVNGYQVLQHLKADTAWRDIPVIMISALDEVDSAVRCIAMGAEDYLPKPFNAILLKARIGACLEKKRRRDQELEYLRHVTQVTAAAAAVEAGTFAPESIAAVAARHDELGQLARVFQRMGQEVWAREHHLRQLHQAASRFVPEEYLGFLQKESIVNINLGDHVSNEMTVMFSDLRGFTAISETMTPQENFDFVNAYLRRVSPVVREHHGFIVKYLGDGMMAIFPRCADDAVQAGLEKLNQVTLYNDYRRTKGRRPIQVGIGVNTGHMMVGIVGERHRMQGDAFSDDVNLTSRLEGLTKYYHVSCIISAATYAHLADPSRYNIRFLDKVQVQGKQHALDLYEVYDADLPPLRTLKQETQADFEEALRLYYAQEFAEAQTKLFGVLQRNPKDRVAWQHLVQATQLAEKGAAEGWTGVTTMTEK